MIKSGSVHVTRDYQVVQNLTINNGTIDIDAKNITVRDVRITRDAPKLWAIIVRPGASATIEHVDISGVDAGEHSVENAVLSQTTSKVWVNHANLHDCSGCIQGENVTATGNYIHDGPAAGTGIQCNGNAGCGLQARGNTVLSRGVAIALFGDFGTPRNSTISENLVGGGSYTIYGGTRASTSIHIDNNRFSQAVFRNGGRWGPVTSYYAKSGNTFSGNIWDNGTPLTCPACHSGPSAAPSPRPTSTSTSTSPTPSSSDTSAAPSRPPTPANSTSPATSSTAAPTTAVPGSSTPAGSATALGVGMNASNTGFVGDGVSEGSLTPDPTTTYGTAFNGQTITGKLYTHRIDITGSNITIKDCKVYTGGLDVFGINIRGSNNTVDHCQVVAPPGQSLYEPIFISPGSDGAKVTRNDISRGENLLTTYGTHATIAENYMHDVALDSNPGDHPDGIEIYGGGPVLISSNRIVEGSLYDSPINAAPYGSYTLTDMSVVDNFLDNGQAMVLIDNQNNSGFIRNTRVERNVMGGHTNPDTNNSFGRYKALENYESRPILQTEAQLAANPNAILWPTSGPDANHWGECSYLTPDRSGQVVVP